MGYGRSCVFTNCFTNDDPDILPRIGFLQIPLLKREDYQKWKKELLDTIKRYQVLKPKDYLRIEKGKMHICLKHFEENDMYFTSKIIYRYLNAYCSVSNSRVRDKINGGRGDENRLKKLVKYKNSSKYKYQVF